MFKVWEFHYDMDRDVFDVEKDGDDFDIVVHGTFADFDTAIAVAEKIHTATGYLTMIYRENGDEVWNSGDGVLVEALN